MRAPKLLLASATLAAACAPTPERPQTEDQARIVAPLPACVIPREGGGRTAGVTTSLKEVEAWQAVFPSFDAKGWTLGRDARACNGQAVLDDPLILDTKAGAATLHVAEGDAVIAGGPDRLRVAWLRTATYDDGTQGGPLALLRAYDSTLEVFAVGAYRGQGARSHFSLERLGTEVVVVAEDDACATQKAPCESLVHVYLPRQGRLGSVAKFAVERRAVAVGAEPGVYGRVEYRLTASPVFGPDAIHLVEHVVARDAAGRDVRRAELTRMYSLLPDDTMAPSDDSIWWRVYPRSQKGAD